MTICTACQRKRCLKRVWRSRLKRFIFSPCKRVEKLLPKEYSGKAGNLERSHPIEKIEEIAIKRAFSLKFGHKTAPNRVEY